MKAPAQNIKQYEMARHSHRLKARTSCSNQITVNGWMNPTDLSILRKPEVNPSLSSKSIWQKPGSRNMLPNCEPSDGKGSHMVETDGNQERRWWLLWLIHNAGDTTGKWGCQGTLWWHLCLCAQAWGSVPELPPQHGHCRSCGAHRTQGSYLSAISALTQSLKPTATKSTCYSSAS